jgi:hypothetical protein
MVMVWLAWVGERRWPVPVIVSRQAAPSACSLAKK